VGVVNRDPAHCFYATIKTAAVVVAAVAAAARSRAQNSARTKEILAALTLKLNQLRSHQALAGYSNEKVEWILAPHRVL